MGDSLSRPPGGPPACCFLRTVSPGVCLGTAGLEGPPVGLSPLSAELGGKQGHLLSGALNPDRIPPSQLSLPPAERKLRPPAGRAPREGDSAPAGGPFPLRCSFETRHRQLTCTQEAHGPTWRRPGPVWPATCPRQAPPGGPSREEGADRPWGPAAIARRPPPPCGPRRAGPGHTVPMGAKLPEASGVPRQPEQGHLSLSRELGEEVGEGTA